MRLKSLYMKTVMDKEFIILYNLFGRRNQIKYQKKKKKKTKRKRKRKRKQPIKYWRHTRWSCKQMLYLRKFYSYLTDYDFLQGNFIFLFRIVSKALQNLNCFKYLASPYVMTMNVSINILCFIKLLTFITNILTHTHIHKI